MSFAVTSLPRQPEDRHIQASYRGCLLGGAVGDALGAPIEFMSSTEILKAFGPESKEVKGSKDRHQISRPIFRPEIRRGLMDSHPNNQDFRMRLAVSVAGDAGGSLGVRG